jgi:hypothetical protein
MYDFPIASITCLSFIVLFPEALSLITLTTESKFAGVVLSEGEKVLLRPVFAQVR